MKALAKMSRKVAAAVLAAGAALGVMQSSAAADVDIDHVPSDKANVFVFQRSSFQFGRILTFGLAGKGDGWVDITLSEETAGKNHAPLRGFNKGNFAVYQVDPGVVSLTLSHKKRQYAGPKRFAVEGGKNYFVVWTPPSALQRTFWLFSRISETNARHQLEGRTCFGSYECGKYETEPIKAIRLAPES